MEYFSVILILILSLIYVFYPLIKPSKNTYTFDSDERIKEGMEYDKNILYQQILELDFDHELGNIESEDYKISSKELKIQAAKLISTMNGSSDPLANHCVQCGKAISADDKFCPFCGNKLV